MTDIETPEDLYRLVDSFYDQAKKDSMLGPIFNQFVDDWEPHIQKVSGFWAATIFASGTYRGNPMALHQEVDEKLNHSLSQSHFNKWVEIWHETVDSMFMGSKADMAKQRASNIANIMFIKLYQAREKSS
ncbi:group III truncated hemoglobin [Ekhidna sp. To15]|uniref:group III truncated hemoglobin n=1 Tax=Ekhidna sp. To15 TaxID=3395267 RepID=UPI003F526CFB